MTPLFCGHEVSKIFFLSFLFCKLDYCILGLQQWLCLSLIWYFPVVVLLISQLKVKKVFFKTLQFSSLQSLSRVWLFATPWIAACQASLSITNSWSLLKLMSIESVMPSSHLILCCPFPLPLPIPPASGSFPMSQLFSWSGQSTGVSALASFLL